MQIEVIINNENKNLCVTVLSAEKKSNENKTKIKGDKENNAVVSDDKNIEMKEDQNGGGDLNRDTNVKEMQYVKEPLELPLKLQLKDPMPGEPPFLRRRSFPRAIRFFKQKLETDPHKFYLQHLLLFWPFQDEKSLFSDSLLLFALVYIAHPEIVTNSGPAIPPIAAETNASG